MRFESRDKEENPFANFALKGPPEEFEDKEMEMENDLDFIE
jgi:hypothetical protein